MNLFVLVHRPGRLWQSGVPFPEQPGIMDHIAFMHGLDQRGQLVLGGPFDDEPRAAASTTAVGMAIITAADLVAARAVAAGDESVRAGLIDVTVRPWRPRMGSALTEGPPQAPTDEMPSSDA